MNAVNTTERKAMTLRVLEGQRAIVTGANSGIGEGVARGLAEAGAKVVVNYVTGPERAEQVADEIRQTGGEAIANYFTAVGIKVRVRIMERAAFLSTWRDKKLKNVFVGATGAAGHRRG